MTENIKKYLNDSFVARWAALILIALAMFFVGGIMDPNFVWDFADIGIGLMTVFNILAILLMSKQAMSSLDEYTLIVKERKKQK